MICGKKIIHYKQNAILLYFVLLFLQLAHNFKNDEVKTIQNFTIIIELIN